MKVFVDTNVLMDYVFSREGCLEKEQQIFALSYLGKLTVVVSSLSIINTVYVAKHYGYSLTEIKKSLLGISEFIEVADLTGSSVIDMLEEDWSDYEDSTQHASAQAVDADCLITCNKKDFKQATIPIYTPVEFCAL